MAASLVAQIDWFLPSFARRRDAGMTPRTSDWTVCLEGRFDACTTVDQPEVPMWETDCGSNFCGPTSIGVSLISRARDDSHYGKKAH